MEAIAIRKASGQNIATKVIAGILIGGAGITAGVPALGGVFGAWLLKSAWDSISEAGNRLKVVRDLGCYAWVLDEIDFRTYARQFGEQATEDELNRALSAGCELSHFAHNWLRTRITQPALPPVRGIPSTEAARRQIEPQNREVITKLETALKVTPPEPFKPVVEVKTQTETWNPFASSEIDIVKEAGGEVKNLFIVGLGGSGKGVLVSCLLREIKKNFPDRKVFVINGKDDPKEYGYYDDIANVQKRLDCESSSPSTVAAWFEHCVSEYDEYVKQNDGALLVIDEGTIIGARLKAGKSTALGDKLIGVTSTGGSRNKNIYFIAQTPYVGANGSDLSAISQLTPIVLVHKSNTSVLDTWKSAKLFRTFDKE